MALALSFTMLCGTSVSVVSAATSGSCGATGSKVNYSYDVSTNVLTISGTGAIKNYADSTAAVLRAPWYEYKSKCVSVVIQEGVTKIGNYNFSNKLCVSIKNYVWHCLSKPMKEFLSQINLENEIKFLVRLTFLITSPGCKK